MTHFRIDIDFRLGAGRGGVEQVEANPVDWSHLETLDWDMSMPLEPVLELPKITTTSTAAAAKNASSCSSVRSATAAASGFLCWGAAQ